MSSWTYCYGLIRCNPLGRSQAEKRFILETVLNHLPIIEGSETPLYTHIVQHGGHTFSMPIDEFGWKRGYEDFHRTYLQSDYTVVLEGCFRDTDIEDMKMLFDEWVKRFAQRVRIEDIHIKISDGYCDEEFIYDNNTFDYDKLFQSTSWGSNNKSKNWCEFLMFDLENAPEPLEFEERQ